MSKGVKGIFGSVGPIAPLLSIDYLHHRVGFGNYSKASTESGAGMETRPTICGGLKLASSKGE